MVMQITFNKIFHEEVKSMNISKRKKAGKKYKLKKIKVNTPHIILFIKGFWAAKVLKTAGYDKETGLLYSVYFETMANRYESYCHLRIKQLEEDLYNYRNDGVITISKDRECASKLAELDSKIHEDIQHSARDMDRLKNEKCEEVHLHQSYSEKLTEIAGKIEEEEGVLSEEFLGLAKKIEEMFAAYANGMLLRHSLESCLPKLDTFHVLDLYHSRYREKDAMLINYLKEVSHV